MTFVNLYSNTYTLPELEINIVIKRHIINNFKTKISGKFIMTSRRSTLCSGPYMQLIKRLGHHLSGSWSRCTGGRYIERLLT